MIINQREFKNLLRPETFPVVNGKGQGVEYTDLVITTISSVVKIIDEDLQMLPPQKMTMYLKDGDDGAVTMPSLKSRHEDDNHIFQYGIIPQKLTHIVDDSEVVLW